MFANSALASKPKTEASAESSDLKPLAARSARFDGFVSAKLFSEHPFRVSNRVGSSYWPRPAVCTWQAFGRCTKTINTIRMLIPRFRLTVRQCVRDYSPKDAVRFRVSDSRLEGIMQRKILRARICGACPAEGTVQSQRVREYGVNGLCRWHSSPTTISRESNSGSPVIDGEGRLVNEPSMATENGDGDIAYDPQYKTLYQRGYPLRALFIVDKYASAKHLVDEMTLWCNLRSGSPTSGR